MSIYFIHAPEVALIKIGYSKNWRLRFYNLSVMSAVQLELLAVSEGTIQEEQALHRTFGPRVRGEWFDATAELFGFCEELALAPDSARRTLIQNRIARFAEAKSAARIEFNPEDEREAMRSAINTFVEIHGRERMAEIADVGIPMTRLWSRGAYRPSPVKLIRLMAHDPKPFEALFGVGIELINGDGLIHQIETELAA